MRIAVLMGGTSPERDVSLASGRAVARGLREAGHEVLEVDGALGAAQGRVQSTPQDRDIQSQPPGPEQWSPRDHRRVFEAVSAIASLDVEAVFIALHGVPGEDGTVQGMLELAGLPYTGSGVMASALAMDKRTSKMLFQTQGIPTPAWLQVTIASPRIDPPVVEQIDARFDYPVVVKPNNGGSTVGLSLVERKADLVKALQRAAAYSRDVLVETYIQGRELTVSLLGAEALPVIEIHPEHGLYDYECKYTKGKSAYTVPADLPPEVAALTQKSALGAFGALGCRGFARADFRLDRENVPYCLEVNTIPGMTETSLVPKAARAAGIGFSALVERIVRLALERSGT